MLEIKAFFGEWKEATKEQAERFYKTFCEGSAAIKWEDKQKYFNEHFIFRKKKNKHYIKNQVIC